MRSRLALWSMFLLLVVVSSGCERLRAYKEAWHASDDPNHTGSLSVSVEPREGISINLDGQRVAQVSPWHQEGLSVGQHVLEVRAMGFYPVTLPVALERNRTVHIPVRLRVRAPQPFVSVEHETPEAPRQDALVPTSPAPSPSMTQPVERPGTPGAAPTRRPLPGNTRSLRLTVESRPAAAILVDDTPVDADNVVIRHADGTLAIGEMRLGYRVRPGRALDFIVPHEGAERAAWWVGSWQVKAKSVIRVSATPVVLRRRVGTTLQTATIRRLD